MGLLLIRVLLSQQLSQQVLKLVIEESRVCKDVHVYLVGTKNSLTSSESTSDLRDIPKPKRYTLSNCGRGLWHCTLKI